MKFEYVEEEKNVRKNWKFEKVSKAFCVNSLNQAPCTVTSDWKEESQDDEEESEDEFRYKS